MIGTWQNTRRMLKPDDLLRPDRLLLRLASEVGAAASRAVSERTLRVAVTGLSRAGKTVFLTSLISNLLALAGRDTLPALSRRLLPEPGGRRFEVRLVPAGSERVPRFDYAEKFAALAAGTPHWPRPTEDLAAIEVEFTLHGASLLGARLGPSRLRLAFLDYPGEWLLDLPLLNQDFRAWSAATLARLAENPRQTIAEPFLRFAAGFDPALPADHALIERGHRVYKSVLERLRGELGLRHLQPGRFLAPGPHSDAPYLWFFPSHAADGFPGTNGALLRDRYDAYRDQVRTQFFETRFLEFDRQIVLVDVLSALYAGRAAFADTEQAIADIAGAYTYGANPWAFPLLDLGARTLGLPGLARRIEHVAFVAAKADHVPAPRRNDLVALLRTMAEPGSTRMEPARRGLSYHAVAAVRATRDDRATIGNREADVVVGVPSGEDRARPFFAGDIPAGRPAEGFWSNPYYALPDFRPPRIDPSGAAGTPHIGLDTVLMSVIGDRLP